MSELIIRAALIPKSHDEGIPPAPVKRLREPTELKDQMQGSALKESRTCTNAYLVTDNYTQRHVRFLQRPLLDPLRRNSATLTAASLN
jgi:hypothetical protein